ncbi:hypothetical protein PCANC_26160 [Puccinia coronata f. sp. avenae]|uniref:Uncharacterized protein n=1 Tax=Puccinia coronata f. sp. avenae TaxID=200324 RepID=A0A2N5S2F4_9BASI|nr:hypothetical protein PCANC_26160 [Puccinia coronata f. sp. avenae]
MSAFETWPKPVNASPKTHLKQIMISEIQSDKCLWLACPTSPSLADVPNAEMIFSITGAAVGVRCHHAFSTWSASALVPSPVTENPLQQGLHHGFALSVGLPKGQLPQWPFPSSKVRITRPVELSDQLPMRAPNWRLSPNHKAKSPQKNHTSWA